MQCQGHKGGKNVLTVVHIQLGIPAGREIKVKLEMGCVMEAPPHFMCDACKKRRGFDLRFLAFLTTPMDDSGASSVIRLQKRQTQF